MVTNGAARQRLHEERKRNGLIVLNAVVVEEDVIAVLQAEGLLDTAAPDRRQLSEAFSRWAYQMLTRQGQALWDVP